MSRLEETGIPLHKMVEPIVRGGQKTDINERIADLSVPISLATMPPNNDSYKLKFKSNTPVFTYQTIPESLFDTLVDLVSVKSASRTTSRRHKPVSSTKHRTSKKNTRVRDDSSDSDNE